jgi:hypothetical protein
LKDKEKTPVAKSSMAEKAPQSTISRLESKYSDILDRVAKRKQKQQEEKDDRDKTLEPDYRPAPLMKSQTTANVMKSEKLTTQKERTPFRMDRTKSKYGSDADMKLKRSEMIGLGSSSNLSNYHDTYTKMKSNDSGYYDGYRGFGKENIYKSKYDPDVLYSELSSGNGSSSSRMSTTSQQQQPYAGSSTSRQIKPYKRTESGGIGDKRRTAINLYELLHDEDSEPDSRQHRRHQYTQRKSTGNQLRLDNATTRREFQPVNDDEIDLEKTERENKRKEIQSLIMKYAQMDDFYGKSSGYNGVDATSDKDANNNASARVDPWDKSSKHSPVVIPAKSANPLAKSQTSANIPSNHYGGGDSHNYSSWYMSGYNSNNVVPIKTNVTPSSSRSRMSKALSTFVRLLADENRHRLVSAFSLVFMFRLHLVLPPRSTRSEQ